MLICPKCGKTQKEVKFIEAFCIDCYPFNLRLPGRIEIDICKRCGKMRIKGEWTAYDRKKLEEHIASKARGEFEKVEYDSEKQEMIFTVKGATINKPYKFEKKTVICSDCSRVSGGYYESIIQLRGDEKKVAKYSKILMKMLKAKTFITKSEEKHGGTDIYAGKTRVVLEVMAELGLKRKITRKLVGIREGKRSYRTTFSIRFE